MKKLLVLSLASLFIATIGCKKVEDDPSGTTSAYKTMTTYMVDNNMDLDQMYLTDWIVGAPTATWLT